MRYLARFAMLLTVTAAFCCLGLTGCGESQAEKTPEETPPAPTGVGPSSNSSVPVTPNGN